MSKSSTFRFNWGSQQSSHILNGLRTLAVGEVSNVFLADIILACEGEYIEAHRLVLSLCSSFFKDLFNQNEKISDKANGIVILANVSARYLRYILQFMYQGSVEVPQTHVDGFLQAVSILKVEGLDGATGIGVGSSDKTSRGKPCPKSKKSDVSISKPKKRRRRSSGSSGESVNGRDDDGIDGAGKKNDTGVVVKSEPCLIRVVTAFDDDDTADQLDAGLLDDFDTGGDSDLGGDAVSGDKGEDDNARPTPRRAQLNLEESGARGGSGGRRTTSNRAKVGGRPRGAVWEHFDYDAKHQISNCRHCKNQIRGAFATNLKLHLKSRHMASYMSVMDKEDEMKAERIMKKKKR